MKVEWLKCKGGIWCELNKVNLDHDYVKNVEGVYIIWSGEKTPNVLKVGVGRIRNELMKYRLDIAMKAFEHLGLFVTWSEVSALRRNGVATYLVNELQPKFPTPLPRAIAAQVNLPWDSE